MFASWCLSAWKWPIVTPNCSRVLRVRDGHVDAGARRRRRRRRRAARGRRRARAARPRRRPAARSQARAVEAHACRGGACGRRPGRARSRTPPRAALDEREAAAGVADDEQVRARRVGHVLLRPGERARRPRARQSSGCQPPPGSAKATLASASPVARRGSQRRCCSGLPPSASARLASVWPRKGPGAAKRPSVSADERGVEELEARAAVRLGDHEARERRARPGPPRARRRTPPRASKRARSRVASFSFSRNFATVSWSSALLVREAEVHARSYLPCCCAK